MGGAAAPSLVLPLSLGYLVGSIPFAFVVSRIARGVDIRQVGSGNVGATNVLRSGGVRLAICVLALDMAKGAASVLWASRLMAGDVAPALAGVAAVIGHIYPPWLRFHGGKGVATATGVFGMLTPIAIAPAIFVFVAAVWLTRYVAVGSVAATLALAPIAWSTGASPTAVMAAAVVAALVVFRHRGNLARLRAGSEPRIDQRVWS